jgi:hypothetical protein
MYASGRRQLTGYLLKYLWLTHHDLLQITMQIIEWEYRTACVCDGAWALSPAAMRKPLACADTGPAAFRLCRSS